MPGTVNAIVPLSLLEAVRAVDIPEGGEDEVEYVQEHRNKRLGLSDTVIAQIRRYKDALKRNQQIQIHEAAGIARLIGRRPDAEGIFTRAGDILADRMYNMISGTTRQIIHIMPGFVARPLAFRQVKKVGEKYLGAKVRRVGSSIVLVLTEAGAYAGAPTPACARRSTATSDQLQTSSLRCPLSLSASCSPPRSATESSAGSPTI